MEYYSRGKLLITGEYLVLNGATALAVPVRYGQWLRTGYLPGNGHISWNARIKGKPWFRASLSFPGFSILETDRPETAAPLVDILKAVFHLKSSVFTGNQSLLFETDLEFDLQWGLGSSSTLLSNLASWADIDPYELLALISKGSGYDIACAKSEGPLLFSRGGEKTAIIQAVHFMPAFHDHIHFVYSGQKQKSESSVSYYLSTQKPSLAVISKISEISRKLPFTIDLKEFNSLIREHGSILSGILGRPTVKEERFPDFDGEIKSLGAWGGDFLMASGPDNTEKVRHYFKTKGLDTVFTFNELVLC